MAIDALPENQLVARYGGAYPAQPYSSGNEQTTRPPYIGLGPSLVVVPRRGWDSRTQQYLEDLLEDPLSLKCVMGHWQAALPIRLLWLLGDLHPIIAMARSAWLRLAFADSETQFLAVSSRGNQDKRGTAAINALIESLPIGAGGITGLQNAIGEQVLFTGLACLECVPDVSNTKLANLVTFDPTTIRFRDTGTGERYLEQLQPVGYRILNTEKTFAIGIDSSNDNPYGRPIFAAALMEALSDTQIQRSLSDVMQAVAWPRLSVGFPFQEMAEFALEHPEVCVGQREDGSDLTPSEYAMTQFMRLKDRMNDLKADDVFLYPKEGMVGIINGAQGMSALAPVLEQKRLRMCQAVDTLPSILGITDGGTQAYSTVAWGVQAKKIESFRRFVNGVICKAFNLHLRLLGMNLTAEADSEPIRSSDALVDEQARAARITNEQQLVTLGYQTRETAAITLTGSEPVISDEDFQAQNDEQAVRQAEIAAMSRPQPGESGDSGAKGGD